MGAEKTIENLRNILDTDKLYRQEISEAIKRILKKLEKKERKLKREMKLAKSKKEVKRIDRKIRMSAARRKKGRGILKDLG